MISNTIAAYLEKEDISNLCSCRAGLPQGSPGFNIPGIPSISVDGSEAIAYVVRHLVRAHRCSRFALLGGPPKHAYAEATMELLDRKIPFDALFCINDRMALGALEVLHSKGIQVPDDLAVIGFDGIEESRYNPPPLTTVVQSIRATGLPK